MTRKPTISIIGPGKVGIAIGALAVTAGYSVVALAGRNKVRARAAAKVIGRRIDVTTPSQAAAAGQVVLLTVPDRTIAPLCQELAEEGAFTPGAIVAHCSGALGSDVLEPARALCGCRVASLHPLMTFPTARSAIAQMKDTYAFLEGDESALAVLAKLAKAIGAIPMRLGDPGGEKGTGTFFKRRKRSQSPFSVKALYHASACMASNYLVALMDAAVQVAEAAGIERRTAWVALAPLIEATLNNITRLGPAGALTGPIARGDAETVARHLAALRQNKDLSALYRCLGLQTVGLAVRKKSLPPADARKLRKILEGADN